ncbi:MAG: hypothetical protein M5R36_18450 [Deltaproteobacteria bacterium]|nr:hypothetical protein [Deltaproteobacteria bacterium]
MSIDTAALLRRKRRARLVLLVILLIAAAAGSAVLYVLKNKDRYIASKLDRAVALLEKRTGLDLSYEELTTDMRRRVVARHLRVTMGGGPAPRELARVDQAEVRFELTTDGALPVKLRSLVLEGGAITLEIGADGKPVLPEPILALAATAKTRATGKPSTSEGEAGGTLDQVLRAMLGLEVKIRRGALTVVDHHYAKRPPGRLAVSDVDGEVFVDLLGRKINADAKGRVDGASGGPSPPASSRRKSASGWRSPARISASCFWRLICRRGSASATGAGSTAAFRSRMNKGGPCFPYRSTASSRTSPSRTRVSPRRRSAASIFAGAAR